jgi:4-amino-4-deoxy-L-arabinose transferase-like glycosyltransferase
VSLKSHKLLPILLVLTFVSRVILAFRPEIRLTERPYQEDAFYLFSCAAHLANGQGFSVDGVHPTNGVQPLAVVLYAPFFAIAGEDRWLALRLTFILVGLLETFCVYAIYRLVKVLGKDGPVSERAAITAAALWTFLYTLLVHNANGLETGLLASVYLSVLWLYAVRNQKASLSWKDDLWLGILLGILVLARIDSGIFVAVLLAYELVKYKFTLESLKRCLTVGLLATAVSSPWWIYNVSQFGSFMPISGQSESIESLRHVNLYTMPQVVGDLLTVMFYSGYNLYSPLLSTFWGILMIAMWTIVLLITKIGKRLIETFNLRPLIPLALAGLVLLVYYTFYFSAPHFIGRYLHPLRIVVTIVFAMFVPLFLDWLREHKASKGAAVLRIAAIGVAALAIYFNAAVYLRCFTTQNFSPVHLAGLYAQKVAPEKVGMTSSGTANFISTNVVNLDGKVNADALVARRHNQLGKYVVDAGITYLADWKGVCEAIAFQAHEYGAEYKQIDSLGPIYIYKRTN